MNTLLSPLALIGGIGMILVAVGFTSYVAVRHLGWKYFVLGMLAWVITIAIKFAIAIPMNPPIFRTLTNLLPAPFGTGVFDVYVGLLTGLTEVLLIWFVMRYSRLGRATWAQALAFGIGFGAVEAFLLGIGSVSTMLSVMLSPQSLPPQAIAQISLANNPLLGLAPIVERAATVFVHIFSNVLIFYGVATSQWRWFWFAFIGKSLLDAWASYGQLSGMTGTLEQIWVLEAGVVLFGILSASGMWWVARRYSAQATLPSGARLKRWSANGDFASWGALGLIVFLALGLSLVGSAQNTGLTGQERENVLDYTEPKTTNLLTALDGSDYASFSLDLNERMKTAIPHDKFADMRSQVNGKIGHYVSRQVERVERSGEYVTVFYAARFENDDPVAVRVSFRAVEPHAITGLWIDSQKLRGP